MPQVAVDEVDLPIPGPGQVLVKMVAAAVNPSDEGDLRQAAKHLPKGIKLPKVFGREGSGVVVASGGGLMARGMVGKKVGVCSREGGTWQVTILDMLEVVTDDNNDVAGVCLHASTASMCLFTRPVSSS